MAKLVFGMNQSLDGYVDHMAFTPSPTLFRHFIEEVQGQAGSVYGRQMYEVSHALLGDGNGRISNLVGPSSQSSYSYYSPRRPSGVTNRGNLKEPWTSFSSPLGDARHFEGVPTV